MKLILPLALVALLAGCANTMGLAAHSKTSTFDGSRTVWIAPHGTNCGMSMVCDSLGAQWTSAAPKQALLQVSAMNGYTRILSVAVNVDGTVTELKPADDATHLSNAALHDGMFNPDTAYLERSADRYFFAPLALVRNMAASKHVKLRVTFGNIGALDSVIVDGKTDSKAYYALKRFLAKVDQATDGK